MSVCRHEKQASTEPVVIKLYEGSALWWAQVRGVGGGFRWAPFFSHDEALCAAMKESEEQL